MKRETSTLFYRTLLFFFFIVMGANVFAEKRYYEINVSQEIGSTSWIFLRNGMAEAKKMNVDAIFLHLNTYGGLVDYADSMRTAILNSKIPVYAFIDNNAASAGALISIACDSIYMRQGASIGAATVVEQNGEKAMDKYQSYMRSIIRSTAESHGKGTVITPEGDTLVKWVRDPLIAEAMVDDRVVVPGIVDSTHILTFTALEAVKNHYCEGIYENIDEIIQQSLKENDYVIQSYKPTDFDKVKGWVLDPIVHGLLIIAIIGGIYFEMQAPGLGFPSIVALVAAILYFAPLYIDGVAEIWEILMFVVGIILILLEIFVVPGFGVTGIAGFIFVAFGLTLTLINNDFFNFDRVESHSLTGALLTVILALFGSVALIIYLTSKIGTEGMFQKFALMKSQDVSEGYSSSDATVQSMVGKVGVTSSVLRPSGKVYIDGDYYDAVSVNGFIDEGESVIVKNYSAGQLYVVKE